MHSIAWWPTLFAVSVATFTDLRNRRIPNWLVVPFLLAGVLVSVYTAGWHGLTQSSLGMLLAAVPMGLLYWLGGMGMGDVKLCVAIGAWLGPDQLALALVLTGIAGGVMAVAKAVCGGFLNEALGGTATLVAGLCKGRIRPHETLVLGRAESRSIPYAPAIAFGTLVSFFAGTK